MLRVVEFPVGFCFAGQFIIVEKIGEGGFGAVYLVQQVATGYLRALKVMSPELLTNAHTKKVFGREVRNAAHVDSDHVAKVLLAGVDDATGCPYLLMERYEGRTLGDIVEQSGPLTLEQVERLARELAHGVGAMHAAAVIHRDLKPDNLMYVKSRRVGEPFIWMVIDLGISVPIEADRSGFLVTATLGNPRFVSPEQCQVGGVVRPSSDVWSLGLVAFYALTGMHYWLGQSVPVVLNEILVAPLVLASERARALGFTGTLPAGLDAWFAKCVNRAPEQRFPDAVTCARALEALVAQGIVEEREQQEREQQEREQQEREQQEREQQEREQQEREQQERGRHQREQQAQPAPSTAASGGGFGWLFPLAFATFVAWQADMIPQSAKGYVRGLVSNVVASEAVRTPTPTPATPQARMTSPFTPTWTPNTTLPGPTALARRRDAGALAAVVDAAATPPSKLGDVLEDVGDAVEEASDEDDSADTKSTPVDAGVRNAAPAKTRDAGIDLLQLDAVELGPDGKLRLRAR